tara:strand:+ start:1687 stop:6048 length:4362 start_codon:yes stop_codon:yes gene_type:complete
MSIFSELDYNSSIRDINGIQFGIQSPEEIRKRSVVHVTQPILFEPNGDPVIGGLFDPRMGVLDRGKLCPTDEQNSMFCPGYFGHIELARPVIYTQFMSDIVKIMKCTCVRCSRLLIPYEEEIIENIKLKKGRKRLVKVMEYASKMKFCNRDGCNAPKPKSVKQDGYSKIILSWNNNGEDKKQELNPELILKIFKRITDEDCRLLGLSPKWCRPEWLICTVLPVPPPSVRPSVKQYNNVRSEDDITHKLIDIIKTNTTLRNKINNKSIEQMIIDWTNVLQYHVSTLIDNEIPGISPASHRSGRNLKTLKQRLKGKDSRIRGNLMGKRVNYSARSVITPDSNISIDELGVPIKIAKNLTYPDIVTKYNIEFLYKCIRNGPEKHPGAKSIKSKTDGKTRRIHNLDRNKIILEHGDIVNRHLMDGDIVLFNRQPSLHKMSMMAHRVKVMKGNTFRLNLAACKPYNADFDGDEMNMHVPRSLQTLTELKHIANIKNQVISPSVSKPIIYPVQDTLVGIYLLTQDGIYFTKNEMMNILMKVDNFDGVFPEPEKTDPVELWSSRQLLSIILPKINLNMGKTKINNGQFTDGYIDKKILTAASKGLVHMIFNDYGPDRTQMFLDNVQDIVREYLLNKGFSVGISGLIADDTINGKMRDVVTAQKKEVLKTIQHVHLNIFENVTGRPNEEVFEEKIRSSLNKTLLNAGDIGIKSFTKDNGFVTMVNAGSKGSVINIAQMISCLGQQSVDGKRIPKGYVDRTLPHYHKYDNTPESRGFVESSFINGLTPQEFFFHAMGGREGLIDTAVKTSETGYIQRKLIKAMEDLRVSYDLSVRNENGSIIQFMYSGDGIEASKMERVSLTQKIGKHNINYKTSKMKTIVHLFKFSKTEKWTTYLLPDTIIDMKNNVGFKDILNNYFETIKTDINKFNEIFNDYDQDSIMFGVDINRLIHSIKNKFSIDEHFPTDLNPLYVIEKTKTLLKDIKKSYKNNNYIIDIFIRFYLAPKLICKIRRFTKTAFDFLVEEIKIKLINAQVQNGEMVGPVAAQSMGEPSTQMTLNTFHFAGVSEKSNVTRGVPRLKEILHISKSIKKPSLTIHLDDEHRFNKEKTEEILSNIELTKLKDIIKSSKIYYDPNDTNVIEDIEFLKLYEEFNNFQECDTDNMSPWLLRLEFDREEMMNRNITMDDIHLKIVDNTKDTISCVYTDDNYDKMIFRIKIKMPKTIQKTVDKDIDNGIEQDIIKLKIFEKTLLDTILKGVSKIQKVTMRKVDKEWVLDTDGINMIKIFSNNGVDYKRTISNDVIEIYDVLGIEAARNILVKEMVDVIESSGQSINNRHIDLLAENMTTRGYLMSVDRFGINRSDKGPLAKCSFEETPKILFDAALFGHYDNLDGVSANIMVGQVPHCGTGITDVLLDEVKFINQVKDTDDEIIFDEEEIEACNEENFNFGIDISNIENELINSDIL